MGWTIAAALLIGIVSIFSSEADKTAQTRRSAAATEQAFEDTFLSQKDATWIAMLDERSTQEAQETELATLEAELWADREAMIEADRRGASAGLTLGGTHLRTLTIFSVLCPLSAVGDGSTDACEENPLVGSRFRIANPLGDAATAFMPTDNRGLVQFRFDALPVDTFLRVIQELPAGTEGFVGYCVDETSARLTTTYPVQPGLDSSLGITHIQVGQAADVRCDWFNAPVSSEAASAPTDQCDPSYPALCLPSFPDLDCEDIPAGRFPVNPPDPHGFDGDGDGIGCES